MMRTGMTLLVVLAVSTGCGKQADKGQPSPQEPIGSAGSGSAKPAEPAANANTATDNDKVLVVGASKVDATEMQFNAPSGDKVPVSAVKRLDGTWKVDVSIAGKLVETIDDGVAKDDPKLDALAGVVRISNAVVVVAGSRTKTEPPEYKFDARVFSWNATTNQLALVKKVQFTQVVVPPPPVVDTHER